MQNNASTSSAVHRERKVRKSIIVLPESVPVFGFLDEQDTYLQRFDRPIGKGIPYFSLKLVSETLGLSPILVERTMRRITQDSGVNVFLDAHGIKIFELKKGMMTPEGLTEHFGYRDRILVDAFACFLAVPELMKAKARADAQKAARRRRAAETMDDQDNEDDQHDENAGDDK